MTCFLLTEQIRLKPFFVSEQPSLEKNFRFLKAEMA